jgi:phenylacetate-coenzyme A ligase PaaK-like adenylate-forming protein
VATAWDRHSERSVVSLQNELLREQIRDSIAPFSPLWRRRFAELDRKPASIKTLADLASLPAMGERDVSPSGDPVGMSALVLQANEAGYTLHASGPEVRRALRLRVTRRDAYRRIIDGDTRSTSYVFSGLGFRYPLASTRRDLDAIARAGARLWAVLGLTRNDVLVSAVPTGATTEHVALEYAAIAAGAPALFPGDDPASLAAAVRLAPPTVLALPSGSAAQVLAGLSELASVKTLLLVGAPTDHERIAAAHGLFRAGGPSDAVILAVHAPAGARVLWGECLQSGGSTGLHTYPDLDVVQVIDADTGDATAAAGELVLTQLGLRGSALMRWRTGDVVSSVTTTNCPSCGRSVPRVEGTRRGALVTRFESGRALDLRSIAGVMSGRPDIADWRLVVGRRNRDGVMAAVVHFAAINTEDPAIVIGVASDIRTVTGALPTQLVAADGGELAALGGSPISARILLN